MLLCIVFGFLGVFINTATIVSYDNNYNVESDSLTGGNQSYKDSNQVQFDYSITFTKSYLSTPVTLLTLIDMKYQQHSTEQHTYYLQYQKTTSTNVTFSLVSRFLRIQTSSYYYFQIRHFTFSSNHPNIVHNMFQTNLNVFEKSMTVTQQGLSLTSTYKGCFIINRRWYYNGGSGFKSTISHIDPFSIKCNLQIYNATSSPIVLQGIIIVIFESEMLKLQYGTLVAQHSQAKSVSFNTVNSDAILIGIKDYTFAPEPVKIGVDFTSATMSIISNPVFQSVQFYYCVIDVKQKIQLIKIVCSPFLSKVLLIFQNLYDWSSSNAITTFNDTLTYLDFSSGVLQTQIIKDISSQQILVDFKVQKTPYYQNLKFKFKIITLEKIRVNVLRNSIVLDLMNELPTTQLSDFVINTSTITKKHYSSNNFTLEFNKDDVDKFFNVKYDDTIQQITTQINVYIPTVTKIQTSAISPASKIYIKVQNEGFIHELNTSVSSNMQNSISNIVNVNTLQFEFQYLQTAKSSELQFTYIDNTTKFQVCINFKLITISHIQYNLIQKTITLTLINSNHSFGVSQSEFNIRGSNLKISKISKDNNDDIKIEIDAQDYVPGSHTFTLIHIPTNFVYESVVSDIYTLIFNSINFQQKTSELTLKLQTNQLNSILQVDANELSQLNKSINLQQVTLVYNYTDLNSTSQLTVNFGFDDQTILIHTIVVPLYQIQLCYNTDFQKRADTIQLLSLVMDGLYLLVFLLSVIACRKMYGIQLMFVIQLAFFSLIPIDVKCPPFRGLKALIYASGMTPFFANLEQKPIAINYQSLGILPNFLTNVNIFLLPLFIVPFIYFPLKQRGNKSKDPHRNPCYLKYSQSMICELPFTILLFSSFSIYSSAVINMQTFKFSNIVSSLVSLGSMLLLPIFSILFLFFRKHFIEYQQEFNLHGNSYLFRLKKAVQLRSIYPFIMSWQMILISIFLSIQNMFDSSLYIVLVIEISVSTYLIIIPLYLSWKQNLRNYIHRFIIILIILLQIGTSIIKKNAKNSDNIVFWQPIILLILLALAFINTGIFTFYKCIQFWRSRNVINTKLKLSQMQNLNLKSLPPLHFIKSKGIYYPRSPFAPVTKDKIQDPPFFYHSRVQQWFDQIYKQDLQQVLGIDIQHYARVELDKNKRFDFMLEYLSPLPFRATITEHNDKIITLKDYIQFVGPELIEKQRIANIERQLQKRKPLDIYIPKKK